MELISQYEWAKRKGFSKQYVNQLVKSGKIPLEQGKINPAKADAIMAATQDPGKPTKRKSSGNTEDLSDLLLRTRIKNEVQKGRILEIRAKVESGEYVNADLVRAEIFKMGRAARDHLLSIPDRLAAEIITLKEARDAHDLLTREIKGALEDFINHYRI